VIISGPEKQKDVSPVLSYSRYSYFSLEFQSLSDADICKFKQCPSLVAPRIENSRKSHTGLRKIMYCDKHKIGLIPFCF
jgi:hypothetical protein